MASNFPIVDRNRLISRASRLLLEQSCPASWQLLDIGGDADFGLDVLVQLEIDGGIRHIFFIQLKGTESLDLINKGQAVSFSLKRTTLNLYASIASDVMLVVAEVVLDSTGKLVSQESKIYWQWMSEEIKARRGSEFEIDISSNIETRVHLPIKQPLQPCLDIRDHLERQRNIANAGLSLEDILRRSAPTGFSDTQTALTQLIDIAKQRPAAFSALFEVESIPPLEVQSPIAIEIRALIRAGNTVQAEAALDKIKKDGFGPAPSQRATYLNLQGKVLFQRRQRANALSLFEQAYSIDATIENLLPLAETRYILAIEKSDNEEIRRIRDLLGNSETDDALALRVRIHLSVNEIPEAKNCLDRISASKRLVPTLVLLASQNNWHEAISTATNAASNTSTPSADLVSAQLIAARSAWHAANRDVGPLREGLEEIPLSGAIGTHLAPALAAWPLSVKASEGLKLLGWPPNVELIAPVICGLAGVLGRQEEALGLLSDAVTHRPEYSELQSNFELLAISARKPEKALEANLRQGADKDVLIRRTSLFFELRRYAESVETALAIARAPKVEASRVPIALAIGYAAAHHIGHHLEATELKEYLKARAEWDEYLYFSEFIKLGCFGSKNERSLRSLREGLVRNPNSSILATNLYSNLNANKESEAVEIIELARRLRQKSLLSLSDVLHLVAAHTTLKNWDDASAEAADGLERFQSNPHLLAMGAAAQEMRGKTGAALSMLEQAIAAGSDRISVLHNYMGIALRLGRIDAARSAVDRLLALVNDRAERIELLRLSTLVYVKEDRYKDAYAVAEALGNLVDQTSEQEEGLYINVVMAATLQGPPLGEEFRVIFSRRIDSFCKKWPESKIFRRIDIPSDDAVGQDDLDRVLSPLLGDSQARMQEFELRERQARSGELPIPFVLRPRVLLHYVGDPFTLWEIAGRSHPEEKQLHLNIASGRQEAKSPNPTRDIPLVDLTALLVLDALNIFDNAFAVFQRIAIPRATVGFISQNANGVLAGGAGMTKARSILARINHWVDRIDQPSAVISFNNTTITNADILNDYIQLAKRGKWLVYSDDAICRAGIADEANSICFCTTREFLEIVDHCDCLTAQQIAESLSKLAQWNIGIAVADRYLIASLSGALPDFPHLDASSRLSAFQRHTTFTTLSRAIWFPSKTAIELVEHMAQLLESMLQSPESNVDSVAAVLASWFIRVRILKQTQIAGWKLICSPVMIALTAMHDSDAPRLIETLQKAVAASVGEQKMSVQIEGDVANDLGATAGEITQNYAGVGGELLRKLLRAMPLGTAIGDRCIEGYIAGQQTVPKQVFGTPNVQLDANPQTSIP